MSWFDLLKETWHEFNEDRAQRLGAALAYYVFFSLFPLILLLISFVGYALALGWPAAWDARVYVLDALQRAIPAIGEPLRERIAAVVEARGALGVVGTVTLLWSASNIFAQLDEAFDLIFDVPPTKRAFLTGLKVRIFARMLAVLLVFGVVLLLLASAIVSTVIGAIATYTEALPGSDVFWPLFNLALSFAITTAIFALLFKILPATFVRWRATLVGGVLTALAWELGEQVLAWYLTRTNYTEGYGVIGSIMALLVWIYYSSEILFLGGEFTSVLNKSLLRRQAEQAEAERLPASVEEPAALPAPHSFLLGVTTDAAVTLGGLVAGLRQLGRKVLR